MSTENLKTMASAVMANIEQDLSGASFLQTIHKKTGIKPSVLFVTVTLVILFLALFEIFADLLTTAFGMMYPAYMSFKVVFL